jgi:hypothetical protein
MRNTEFLQYLVQDLKLISRMQVPQLARDLDMPKMKRGVFEIVVKSPRNRNLPTVPRRDAPGFQILKG